MAFCKAPGWARHDHRIAGVQNVQVMNAPVTYVLYRCIHNGSGDVCSEELNGTWTKEQISGQAGRAAG